MRILNRELNTPSHRLVSNDHILGKGELDDQEDCY
jgi:hypothetical protein